VWRPEGEALKGIRDAIVEDPAGWKKARGTMTMIGESLKRPPPGYDPEHPFIDDLKRKDFCLSMEFTDAQVTSKKLPDEIGKAAQKMAPFMRFLAGAVGAEL
jgi:uncharacterized protein (TIGR02453 family)